MTTANTNKITLKQIDAEISTFVTSRKALQAHAHNIAMMILRHAAPAEVSDDCVGSGDCTRALKLVAQMPKSWAAQMEAWFKAFSPIRVIAKNNKCEFDPAYKKLSKAEKLGHWNLEEAAQTPFHELTDEPEVGGKILDFAALLKLIEQQASRIKKNAEEGKIREEDIPSALAMAEKLSKIKFTRVSTAKPANEDKPAAKPKTTGEKVTRIKAKQAA
jgi:hypothetical protein